jgi:hypothetical protein
LLQLALEATDVLYREKDKALVSPVVEKVQRSIHQMQISAA